MCLYAPVTVMIGLTPANRITRACKTGSGVLIIPTVSTVVQPIPPAALFKRSVMILCSSGAGKFISFCQSSASPVRYIGFFMKLMQPQPEKPSHSPRRYHWLWKPH